MQKMQVRKEKMSYIGIKHDKVSVLCFLSLVFAYPTKDVFTQREAKRGHG